MKTTLHTVNYPTKVAAAKSSHQSIVQIYPLDLNRGPVALEEGRFVLGRSSECHLPICDDAVSRNHAEIWKTDRGIVLIDLDSTNGVLVNGEQVVKRTLKSGDCIQLGSHVFRFLADDDLETQYHATVYSMMTRDGLTNAYNKRYLQETLEREVARCRRHDRPIAVIMMDVDHFKSVNDRFGHAIGDFVLREISKRLQSVIRQDDVLARFGGEEFAIVLVEANAEDAALIAETCRKEIAKSPLSSPAGDINLTVSLGVVSPEAKDLGTASELLHDADQSLYEAKHGGRNRTVF